MRTKDRNEQLKEREDTVEKQEFTYPMWFKSRSSGCVVMFDGLKKGTVVVEGYGFNPKGVYPAWEPHTNTRVWEQVENPNKIVDEAIKEVIEEDYKDMINPEHYKTGGIETIDYMKAKSTPEEFRGHLRLTALKYLSRYGQKDNELQELLKCKWYLDRLISEIEENGEIK